MKTSKLFFELSKLPDLPIVMLTDPNERDNEVNVIAIDRHRSTRIVLCDSEDTLAAEYGQTVPQLLNDEYIRIICN